MTFLINVRKINWHYIMVGLAALICCLVILIALITSIIKAFPRTSLSPQTSQTENVGLIKGETLSELASDNLITNITIQGSQLTQIISVVPQTQISPTAKPNPSSVATTNSVTLKPTIQQTIKPTIKPTTIAATIAVPLTVTPSIKPTVIIVPPSSTPTPINISPTVTNLIDYSHPRQVAINCPISTLNCVPCTSGSTCRFEVGMTHGFLGWACQDNNPGNIRPGSAKDAMIVAMGGTASCGQRNDIRGNAYMVFKDYNSGWNSLKAYLKALNAGMHSSYKICGNSNCTLNAFGKIYGGSDTYGQQIASKLGVDPATTTLGSMVSTRLDDLANAIKTVEGFITQ